MAQQAPPVDEGSPAASETIAAGAKPSRFAKVKILLFVVAVIGLECSLAYLYLPSASDAAATTGVTLAAAQAKADAAAEKASKAEKGGKEAGNGETAEQVEVDLGQFSLTAFQPTSNTTLRIDFHLYGTVGAKDEKEFTKLKEENQHRFRDQVIVTVRSAELTDLTDAGLGLMKRKILDKTNRTFGKPLLRTIIFSDFSFIEQ